MAEPRSDRELVERFRRGEGAAFDGLVQRYVRFAGAIAYGVLGDFEAAADAVQESFLKVHESLAGLREPDRFKGWLAGVVRTTALDALRRRRRGRTTPLSDLEGGDDDPVRRPGTGPAPGERAERREIEERVLRAVEALPESYREVVVMKYLDERSYKDISEALGITIETIESRLFRARRVLRDALAGLVEGGRRPSEGARAS